MAAKGARRLLYPNRQKAESQWFSSLFLQPGNVQDKPRQVEMQSYQDLIWNNPPNEIILKYGCTTGDMARLCGQGTGGLILTSHIIWLLDKANSSQDRTLCFCLNTTTADHMLRLLQQEHNLKAVQQLVFVVNVGRRPDNSVYLGTSAKPGNHWALVTVELKDTPSIFYCDSRGWEYPSGLLAELSTYTKHFGFNVLEEHTVKMAHQPVPVKSDHECSQDCLNYPLQTSSDICGVVAVICAVVAALDKELFKHLTESRFFPKIYLTEPSKYDKYLRRVLISWFMTGVLNMAFLKPTETLESSPRQGQSSSGVCLQSTTVCSQASSTTTVCSSGSSCEVRQRSGLKRKSTIPLRCQLYSAAVSDNHQNPDTTANKQARSSVTADTDRHSGITAKTSKRTRVCITADIQKQLRTLVKKRNPSAVRTDRQNGSQGTSDQQINFGAPRNTDINLGVTTDRQIRCGPTADKHDQSDVPAQKQDCSVITPHKQTHSNTTAGSQVNPVQVKCVAVLSLGQNGLRTTKVRLPSYDPEAYLQASSGTGTDKHAGSVTTTSKQTKSHYRSETDNRTQPDVTTNKKRPRRPCPFCNETFSSSQTLFKHKRRKHKSEVLKNPSGLQQNWQCLICSDFRTITILDLISHYKTVHQKIIKIQHTTFTSEEDFKKWKKETENKNQSGYMKIAGDAKKKEHVAAHYYCNRSAFPKMLQDNQNQKPKTQGSEKLTRKCVSHIVTRKSIETGIVQVRYCLEHIGHFNEFGHLKISSDLRAMIDAKLAEGSEPEKLLEDIRDKVADSIKLKDNQSTKPNVEDVKKQYNLSSLQMHSEDRASVDQWVQALEGHPDNPVIYYKPQGCSHGHLGKEDFLLGIQTPLQRDIMKKYASKMVCVDLAHSTSQDDLPLITILVLDESGEAVPVAWAISNINKAEGFKVFLTALKKASQDHNYATEVFMGDLADDLYSAWCDCFSKPEKRFFCPWIVDKAWRKKIIEYVQSRQHQANIYAYLKILESQTVWRVFKKMLKEFLGYTEAVSASFLDYFQRQFVTDEKVHLWRLRLRKGSLAKVDLLAEAFHCALQEIYLSKKQNKRVDVLLVVLLKVSRNKAVEYSLKSGTEDHQLREIRNQHFNVYDVTTIRHGMEEEWKASSSAVSAVHCRVKKVSTHELCQCKVLCHFCSLCVHMYTCTCADFLLGTTTCKHIHAVHALFKRAGEQSLEKIQVLEEEEDVDDCLMVTSQVIETETETERANADINTLRAATVSRLNDLAEIVNNIQNIDTLQVIDRLLSESINIAQEKH